MIRRAAIFFVGVTVFSAMAGVRYASAVIQAEEFFTGLEASITEGVVREGPQGYPRIHLGGLIALDFLNYDSRNARHSGFRLDRALVVLDGSLCPKETWRLAGDLKGVDTRYGLDEAWFSHEAKRWLRVTTGLIKIPLGVEYSIGEARIPFVGYAFPSFLDGRTDLGVRMDGEIREGLFSYDLTVAAGEGFDLFGQKRDDPQVSARVVVYPFRNADGSFNGLGCNIPVISGIFMGGACSYTPSFDGHLDVANPLRNKLFNTRRLDADSSRFFHFCFGIDAGPFRIYAEKVQGSLFDLKTEGGEEDLEDQITAWEVAFSWMVTGEHYDSRPFRRRERRKDLPAKPFGTRQDARDFGALEVAVRYSNADIDRDFFEFNLTDYTLSSQEFRAFTAAVNWHPTGNVRVTAEVVRTIADQDPEVFDFQGRDTSCVLRLQYRL
ncbi:MAG: porin [Thermodesulfobacteriota bacterium]|nr:porin [Thermodesulfobacteriota bacterium]